VTPASAEHQAAAPEQTPQETEVKKQVQPEEPVVKAAKQSRRARFRIIPLVE
jgi:sec-independent protein translocase protein TatB